MNDKIVMAELQHGGDTQPGDGFTLPQSKASLCDLKAHPEMADLHDSHGDSHSSSTWHKEPFRMDSGSAVCPGSGKVVGVGRPCPAHTWRECAD